MILLAAVAIVATAALMALRRGGERGARVEPAASREGVEAAPRNAPGGQAASPALDTQALATPRHALYAPSQRTFLPRPEALTPSHDAGVPPRLKRGDELKDRRGQPQSPADDEFHERLKANMDAVEDDVAECLRAWSQADPDIHGRVSLAFQLDESGLGKVWIKDWAQVPQGPLTCFASAVYGIDWSHITDKPIEITNQFVVEQGEPAQVDVRGPGKVVEQGNPAQVDVRGPERD